MEENKKDPNKQQKQLQLRQSFIYQWGKITWKMRSVYSSFIVHSFDIASDIMVISMVA